MSKIFKIQEKISNLLYPPVCGICGKIAQKGICIKCNVELKKQAEVNILQKEEIEEKNFEELMYLFKYEGQVRKLILDYKFNEKSYMYKTFVNFLLNNKKFFNIIKSYDTIVPVPISKQRYKQRGYNQCELLGREIANIVDIQYENNCIFKQKNIIEQSKLNKEERIRNIQGAYYLKNGKKLKNKNVLVLDDIYTTGSTVNECCKIINEAKPNKIGVLTIAKD